MSQTDPHTNPTAKETTGGSVKLSLSSSLSSTASASASASAKPLSFSFQSKKPAGSVAALFSNDEDDENEASASTITDKQSGGSKAASSKGASSIFSVAPKKPSPFSVKAPESKPISVESVQEKRSVDLSVVSPSVQNPPVKKSRWGEAPADAETAPTAPVIDPEVMKVVEKTAEYVSRAGPALENTIMEKQKDNPQFRFLLDPTLPEAVVYRQLLQAKTSAPWQSTAVQSPKPTGFSAQQPRVSKFSSVPPPAYVGTPQPASVLPPSLPVTQVSKDEPNEDDGHDDGAESDHGAESDEEGKLSEYQKILEAYRRQRAPAPKTETQEEEGRRHHIGDFIPKEELDKFLSKAYQVTGRVLPGAPVVSQTPAVNPLDESNVGHKLMAKMGWQKGQKLGLNENGLEKPIEATKRETALGVGAYAVGDVTPEDDEFELYRKRMMLSYRYRPNPLGNPRKPYY